MIKPVLCGVVMILAAKIAFAGDAERLALSKRVIELSQGELVAQQMLDFLVPAITGLSLQHNPDLTNEQKAKVARLTKEELDAAMPEFVVAAAQIYADHFTEDELENIIAFYESETGQRFQELVPTIMQESIVRSEAISQGIAQRFIDRMANDGDI